MSFDFTTLVTDRTQSDVQRVRSVAAKIINGTASEAETAEWNAATMKGAYNHTDLNRVTAAIEALKTTLEGYGYTVSGYKRIEIPRSDGARLPEGHTELAWIESGGSQYIDTGFKPNQDTKIIIDGMLTSNANANRTLYGARTSATSKAYYLMFVGVTGGMRSAYNESFNYEWAVDPTIRRTIVKDKNTTVIDGVSHSWSYAAFQCDYNLVLFALNEMDAVKWFSYARVYACQVYDNGALARDYVPDMTASGEIGLYDLAGGKFYPNAGTGAFNAGPAVGKKDPYLWYETDIPTPDLMAAYLANVSVIRSVLDMLPTTPAVPADMEQLTTDKANAIERILADINTLIQNMIAAWFYSGEIYTGEVM